MEFLPILFFNTEFQHQCKCGQTQQEGCKSVLPAWSYFNWSFLVDRSFRSSSRRPRYWVDRNLLLFWRRIHDYLHLDEEEYRIERKSPTTLPNPTGNLRDAALKGVFSTLLCIWMKHLHMQSATN